LLQEVWVVTDMMLGEDAAEAMVRAATGRSLKPDCSRPRAMALTGALNGCGLARARSEAIGVMSQLEEGELRFVTQPRTGNCWHGVRTHATRGASALAAPLRRRLTRRARRSFSMLRQKIRTLLSPQ